MPISMTQDNQTYYLHYNQVGTLKAISDKNQNIIKEITYDTFGTIHNDTNPNFKVIFGFAGGLQDRDTNLVHFGYREYDPQTGKWTAKDPIDFNGGDSNLYGYVLGDPVNLVDPEGLKIDPKNVAEGVGIGLVGLALYDYWKNPTGDNAIDVVDAVIPPYLPLGTDQVKDIADDLENGPYKRCMKSFNNKAICKKYYEEPLKTCPVD
jgi:RHS repeat-associated protein